MLSASKTNYELHNEVLWQTTASLITCGFDEAATSSLEQEDINARYASVAASLLGITLAVKL
jgi:hypothetical protein